MKLVWCIVVAALLLSSLEVEAATEEPKWKIEIPVPLISQHFIPDPRNKTLFIPNCCGEVSLTMTLESQGKVSDSSSLSSSS